MSETNITEVSTEQPQDPALTASKTASSNGADSRPDGVPEKFWKDGKIDQEALLKSYIELEKGKGQQKSKQETPGKEDENKSSEGDEQTPPENSPLQPFFDEFAKDGKLSEDSYAKLEGLGFGRDVVDQYVRGFEATQKLSEIQRTEAEGQILSSIGGEENYAAMTSWAKDNLSDADLAAYNKAVESGDAATISLAVTGLYHRYTQSEGAPSRFIDAKSPGNSGVQPFESWAQLTAAINDKRYGEDPAYRANVEKRVAASRLG